MVYMLLEAFRIFNMVYFFYNIMRNSQFEMYIRAVVILADDSTCWVQKREQIAQMITQKSNQVASCISEFQKLNKAYISQAREHFTFSLELI